MFVIGQFLIYVFFWGVFAVSAFMLTMCAMAWLFLDKEKNQPLQLPAPKATPKETVDIIV